MSAVGPESGAPVAIPTWVDDAPPMRCFCGARIGIGASFKRIGVSSPAPVGFDDGEHTELRYTPDLAFCAECLIDLGLLEAVAKQPARLLNGHPPVPPPRPLQTLLR